MHDDLGLAALVVEVQAVQVASLVDERNGEDERSGHVLRGTTSEECNVVDEVVHGRRAAQRLLVVIVRNVEGEAGAVKGGVDGVEEPNDREEEDDVGQEDRQGG